MTWIRVEATVIDHPKTALCAQRCGVGVPAVLGHLVALWGQVALHRPHGDLRDVADPTLEDWAKWRGGRGRFARAFRAVYMDGTLIHGWGERQGKLALRSIKETLRKGKQRQRVKSPSRGTPRETPRETPRGMSGPYDYESQRQDLSSGSPDAQGATPPARRGRSASPSEQDDTPAILASPTGDADVSAEALKARLEAKRQGLATR